MQPDMPHWPAQTADLGRLTRDLAAATPRQAEGSDATGSVQVTLGLQGIPVRFRIRSDWHERLEPERLASAVVDANADAIQRAMSMWTDALDDNRWWQRRADLEETTTTEEPLPPLPYGRVRDTDELAESVLARLHAVRQQSVNESASTEGRDDSRHVAVQIGAGGLTACVIDAEWAKDRDGTSISTALSAALARAVPERAVEEQAKPDAGAELDTLIGDALATLKNLSDQGGTR
jgi:hypothetical protein